MKNMKKLNLFQLIVVICCAWFTLGSITAQETDADTLYVMKNGSITHAIAVNEIDSLVFYRPNFDGEKSDTPEFVEINGVRWATRNVAEFGTFAASPESPGMFYQWNRKKAWPATGEVTGWDSSIPTGDSWEKENDPSPAGCRVPTIDEIKSLLDEDNVTNEWTTVNGVTGRKFTDLATGASIFLPAVHYRDYYGMISYDVEIVNSGPYWSSGTRKDDDNDEAFGIDFSIYGAYWSSGFYRYLGFSVRPVAE
jgi:hypothetical protein